MDIDKSVSFLWNAANTLKPTTHANTLLKCYYMTNAKKIAERNANNNTKRFKGTTMCRKCSTCWFDGTFSVKSSSARPSSSKATKLVTALDSGQISTRKQKKRAKWFKKRTRNSLVISCHICGHKTVIALEKPLKKSVKLPLPEETPILAKSKQKKKDKTAGLKLIEAINSPVQMVKTKNVEKGPFGPKANNPMKESKSSLHKVKENIKKKSQNSQKVVVSKTQQKNALLHLASLLKKSESNKNTSQNDRLKNLLR